MRLLLSYCKSHIYELHSLLVATITFLLMFAIKGPIKEYLAGIVEHKALTNAKWKENMALYKKRCNLVLVVLTTLLSYALFIIVAVISPLIDFSVQSAIMSGVYALTEYAVVNQLAVNKVR